VYRVLIHINTTTTCPHGIIFTPVNVDRMTSFMFSMRDVNVL